MRFINEEKLASIEEANIQKKFWVYSFSIAVFSLCSVAFPTFIGYSFGNALFIMASFWYLFMFSFLLYFSVRFLRLDAKFGVFKRKSDPVLFVCGYLLLTVAFMIVAAFTTKVTIYPNSVFNVHLNPFVFFVVFLPLFFGYETFCYFAFMKCFAKYVKRDRSPKK
jgi:hypothetical protein